MKVTLAKRQEDDDRYQDWWARAKPLFETHDRNRFSGLLLPEFSDTPWSALKKPLNQSKVTLLSSAGIYLPPQARYDDENPQGDYTWRRIPLEADLAALRLAHAHYDHAAAEADINVVYPLQRLQELVQEGVIGRLSDPVYTWHGYVTNYARFRDTVAGELADCVERDGADVALIVPV